MCEFAKPKCPCRRISTALLRRALALDPPRHPATELQKALKSLCLCASKLNEPTSCSQTHPGTSVQSDGTALKGRSFLPQLEDTVSRLCLGGAQQPFLQPKDWEREEKKGFLLSWSIVTMGEKCHKGLVQQGTMPERIAVRAAMALQPLPPVGVLRGAQRHRAAFLTGSGRLQHSSNQHRPRAWSSSSSCCSCSQWGSAL
nr:uncharacterized protein LOC101793665 isoform X1 [Anas platyrhynchos]XP_038020904.1 uncharacterized protein LOC101793665 isoform X1 [Anas platyrhynchos]XP_038020905.1 uncharacterized protein LOC101793665 isoform X1 [Anas platyrhynchos]